MRVSLCPLAPYIMTKGSCSTTRGSSSYPRTMREEFIEHVHKRTGGGGNFIYKCEGWSFSETRSTRTAKLNRNNGEGEWLNGLKGKRERRNGKLFGIERRRDVSPSSFSDIPPFHFPNRAFVVVQIIRGRGERTDDPFAQHRGLFDFLTSYREKTVCGSLRFSVASVVGW